MSVEVHVQPGHDSVAAAWGKTLAEQDLVVLPGADLAAAIARPTEDFARYWERLDHDDALFDGGNYRLRRYGRLLARRDAADRWTFAPLPHAAFKQAAEHIPDYGGRERTFSPILPEALLDPALLALVSLDLEIVEASGSVSPSWQAGLHMIRVVAREGTPGNPAPEGRHRDGHDFIGMHLMRREHCSGGESAVYRGERAPVRLTLAERLDSLVVADALVSHAVSPIVADGVSGVRDMLLVDLNAL